MSLLHATAYHPPATLAVQEPFDTLLPTGGLVVGGVTVLTGRGAWTAGIAMLARTSRSGAQVAFVGLEEIGVEALRHGEWELANVVAIASGPQLLEIAAVLLGGFDVLVLAMEAVGRGWHRLAARAREQKVALVVLDARGALDRHGPIREAPIEAIVRVEQLRWDSAREVVGAPSLRVVLQQHGMARQAVEVAAG
jgi:hypothetical protein